MGLKKEEKLIEYFSQMEFTDILGFAAIVGTEIKEDEEFIDFMTNLVVDFDKLPRSKRRKLLKLAANVAGANQDIKKGQESHSQQTKEILEDENSRLEN